MCKCSSITKDTGSVLSLSLQTIFEFHGEAVESQRDTCICKHFTCKDTDVSSSALDEPLLSPLALGLPLFSGGFDAEGSGGGGSG